VIARVTGAVLSKGSDAVVISVGGLGLLLEVSAVTLRDVPAVGDEGTLFTHLHVREDALQLFGFSSEEERELFRLFLGVSKIGPKLALAALSCRRSADLKRALASGDVALFASVPGIGRKTAERIILELREKMVGVAITGKGESGGAQDDAGDNLLLARSALVELGYTVLEADKLLLSLDPDLSLEELVRHALARHP
jgi:Holliday junction DNA helicase RuvA